MIRYLLKEAGDQGIQLVDECRPGCWVNVENPTQEEIEYLAERFDLDIGTLEDALDQDEMPRIERDGDIDYVFLRHIFSGQEFEPTTSPILCVVGPDLFLTMNCRSLPGLQKLFTNQEFLTNDYNRLLLLLLQHIVGQYEVFINKVSRRIQIIRGRLRTHSVVNEDFVDFVVIEDELNEFMSALQPMTTILRRLSRRRRFTLVDEDKDLIEDLLQDSEQSIESCSSNIKTIVNIREAYSTIASNVLNRTMKFLTGATVLVAMPNVFFGMYGMNVGLPFAEHPYAYFLVVGVTIIVMLMTILVGRANKVF